MIQNATTVGGTAVAVVGVAVAVAAVAVVGVAAAAVGVAAAAVAVECNNKKERHDLTEKDQQLRLLLTRFH